MVDSAERLKIGLVLDDGLDKPDGVQQYILAIGEWLGRQGHDVHYLVGQTTRQDITSVHSLSRNIRVRFNGNRMSIPLPTNRRKLRTFLLAEKFDILHVQVPYSPFMGHHLVQAAPAATAVIGTFHIAPASRLVSLGTKALGLWLRPSLRRFDTMLSVSNAAQRFCLATFNMQSEISPNTIDYQLFHSAQPLPEYDDATKTILFLGRLVPRKGSKLLLTAISKLASTTGLPPFRVLICGAGPLHDDLQQYIDRHGLQSIVSLTGFVSETDKPRFYASADISVFPSNGGESFGIVLLEAMASGKAAVLGGDNDGYRSVLEEQPAMLFDPNDAGQLADRLRDLLLNRSQREEISRWGCEYAANFDTSLVGAKLLDTYTQALRKRREA